MSKASSVSAPYRSKASDKIALATPDPRVPPILLNYDPVLAKENLEKCTELKKHNKLAECKKNLVARVLGGIGSPEEADLLAGLCMNDKDRACGAGLEDAGILKPGMFDQVLKGAPPTTASGSACPMCPPPTKK